MFSQIINALFIGIFTMIPFRIKSETLAKRHLIVLNAGLQRVKKSSIIIRQMVQGYIFDDIYVY